MKSVMSHSFANIPAPTISRSQFDRSCGNKTAIWADYLFPMFVDEVIPGDTMKMNPTIFARLATPIYPLMDNLFVDTFWFFVPNRLVWANWHKFLGAQDDPGDSIAYTIPTCTSTTSTGYLTTEIFDYFGIPTDIPDFVHSALPLRCYNLIYNEWFRDQNLQNSVTVSTADAASLPTDFTLLKRGKRHDYFTSCLPYPQKSATEVTMPLGTSADIKYDTFTGTSRDGDFVGLERDGAGTFVTTYGTTKGVHTGDITTTSEHNLYADLSSATAASINAIRLAVTTQQFLERDARGGTRINEIILSHFGVIVPDSRVQRPEYLGGNSQPVGINTVPQTSGGSDDTAATPQGTLSAFGTMTSKGGGFTKSFTEHGHIIGIINVRADITYQLGIERLWTRSTRYDFFWPEFANIGEQAVLQQEIELTDPAGGTNENVFGYQERYAEYRYKPSIITSVFRSTATATLDPWHLSEELSTPALNAAFIQSNTPMDRVLAVPSEPDFIVDMYFDYKCVRPMPTYGTPGLARF